ncbi:nodulation protein NodH [Falsihalocynthiibacter arcticus]|uniref:Nodulation protein NodH n=1 Tax=Falsihalocynthiibacter arcticus TaxID=1579316 RepID=A0A126UZP1_9RHOB|nr:nodulation protein NodH [Falsihalocynthiibacter arcticus]AML50919.1 nodulation protein NodH [Falsihalocynthiibacter arcticus]
MNSNFDYFVVLAEMRTGSNFLETNINAYDGLTCVGEAFNPHFIGYPNRDELLGMSLAERERDPLGLLHKIVDAPGLAGFRFFHDHDPRVIDPVLKDQKCAKIILTRNPVESYISWKIAKATGQWKLTNVTHHKTAKINFDATDFTVFLDRLKSFQLRILHELQASGQTAFYIGYEDIRDLDVINGLANFLGVKQELAGLSKNLKKQNPSPLLEKVSNPREMERALQSVDHFGLSRTPNFEPIRGASVNRYVTANGVPLLFMPMPSGPNMRVKNWLTALGNGVLEEKFTQKDLRQWKRGNVGHRSFTVLRHPVARAHAAFCRTILNSGPGSFPQIRKTLKRVHNVPIPDDINAPAYNRNEHRAAFLSFLKFLKANLSGQTALRNDMAWSSQASIVQGFGAFAAPDMVLREDTLETDLEFLAFRVGVENHECRAEREDFPYSLDDIYDSEIEAAAQEAYQRDYMTFGFSAWRA